MLDSLGIKKCGRCGAHDHENCFTKTTTSSDGIPIETTVIQEPNSPKPACNHLGKQNNMKVNSLLLFSKEQTLIQGNEKGEKTKAQTDEKNYYACS